MSSREIDQIVRAINTRADALYLSYLNTQTQNPSPSQNQTTQNPQNDENYRMKRMEDTLELLADPELTPKLENYVSNFVKKDKLKQNQQQRISPIDPNMVVRHNIIQTNRPTKDLLNSNGTLNGSPPPTSNVMGGGENSSKKSLPKSIAAVVQRFDPGEGHGHGPGGHHVPKVTIIPVKKPGDGSPPTSLKRQGHSHLNSLNSSTSTTIPDTSSTTAGDFNGGLRKEIVIPIKRIDDHQHDKNNFVPLERSGSGKEIHHKIHYQNSEGHPGHQNQRPCSPYDRLLAQKSRERSISPINTPFSGERGPGIAFAQERIRQSQEHPLTQQRLELQRRLPSPSNNLSSAIALQQGRVKFQNNHENHHHHPQNQHHYHHDIHGVHQHPQHQTPGTSGRQNWLKFGSGSSVADRVQLFEKYPAHIPKTPSTTGDGNTFIIPIERHHGVSSGINHQHQHQQHLDTSRIIPDPNVGVGKDIFPVRLESQQIQPSFTPRVKNPSAPWRTQNHQKQNQNHQVEVIPNLRTYSRPAEPVIAPALGRRYGGSGSAGVNTGQISARSRSRPGFRENVPKFYFGRDGRLPSLSSVQDQVSRAETEFSKHLHSPIKYHQFGQIISSIGIPLYWKKALWMSLGLVQEATLDPKTFINHYRRLISQCPDEPAQFIRIFTQASQNFPQNSLEKVTKFKKTTQYHHTRNGLNGSNTAADSCELNMSDFIPTVQDIIDTHPGLGFLREAPEFHSRYVTTVISRIFYKVNRSWSGKISLAELRRSNLLRIMKKLEFETDINAITEYFSYEHFYVIYCKFWELDKDHDLLIDRTDLASHADHALSSRIIERIFSGTVIRGWDVSTPVKCPHGKMTYSDFVWFLISEEDKKTPTAIEYWFRCLDIDGDGQLSPYELQWFYSEQASRIECLGIEPLDFSNVFCQIVDMLHCSPTGILLKDLKSNPHLAANIFNTLFNLDKYLDHEQRDPFATSSALDLEAAGGQPQPEGASDWDKFASAEYELLIAEESPSGSCQIEELAP